MTWQKGKSGNPAGRPVGNDTVAHVMKTYLTPERRELLAEKLYSMALKGDIPAMRLLLEYTDGKPRQDVGLDGNVFTEITIASPDPKGDRRPRIKR